MKKILCFALVVIIMLSGCSAAQVPPACTTDEMSSSAEQQKLQMPEGVIIALLDTGVSSAAIASDHLLEGYNYITESTDTEDRINHGTAVTSVILGCASAGVNGMALEAYVVPLVVVTKQEGEMVSVTPSVLADAIRDSVDIYEADIINVSLGIQLDDGELREAVEYVSGKGALVVSAVGNSGAEGKPYYPASYEQVLAVGSCDEHGQESDFSQKGADVLAPGEDIWLASRNGVKYGTRGSSYATGFVAATAANILFKESGVSGQLLKDRVIQMASESGGCIR